MDSIVADLVKVSLTEKEANEIVIDEEVVGMEVEECRNSVLVKVLSDRPVNQSVFRQVLRKIWGLPREVRCIEVGEGVTQVLLRSEFQLWRVMEGAPWNFENNLILIKQWEAGLTPRSIVFAKAAFWIQIWGLPLECRSRKVAEIVGSRIGLLEEVDSRTEAGERGRYVRVRVLIPVDKPLARGGFIKVGAGESKWVDYRYEKLPYFCFQCGVLGHESKSCISSFSQSLGGMVEVSEPYGPWLRAFFSTRSGSGSRGAQASRGGSSSSGGWRSGSSRERQSMEDVTEGELSARAPVSPRGRADPPVNPVVNQATTSVIHAASGVDTLAIPNVVRVSMGRVGKDADSDKKTTVNSGPTTVEGRSSQRSDVMSLGKEKVTGIERTDEASCKTRYKGTGMGLTLERNENKNVGRDLTKPQLESGPKKGEPVRASGSWKKRARVVDLGKDKAQGEDPTQLRKKTCKEAAKPGIGEEETTSQGDSFSQRKDENQQELVAVSQPLQTAAPGAQGCRDQ